MKVLFVLVGLILIVVSFVATALGAITWLILFVGVGVTTYGVTSKPKPPARARSQSSYRRSYP